MGRLFHLASSLLISTTLIGCGVVTTNSGSGPVSSKPEASYCSSLTTPSNPIAITATANYFYRQTNVASGLNGNPVSRGIPYAEVIVTNSSGTVVQCSETGATGLINLQIEKIPGTYQLTVNSRAFNSKLKASVLTDPSSNNVYSISKSFTVSALDASVSVGTVEAFARLGSDAGLGQSPNIEGAAFHILYNLYLANEYIRTAIGNSSWVADKVTAYWTQGFNPGAYVGVSGGLSFYLQGQYELYILGGSNGRTKDVDTDHFDDSVIIHEYGHFLEDRYSYSTSPGGSHNGNFIIDPRLAWSEGWANFLQGAVVTVAGANAARGRFYIDTVGYTGDSVETGESGSVVIRFDLNQNGATATSDAVGTSGEGTFRELSVSRLLYKLITTTGVTFAHMWDVFTDANNGMRNPANVFSNVGYFNKHLDNRVPTGEVTNWNNLLANEQQNKTTRDYADPVALNPSCARFPRNLNPTADGTYVVSSGVFQARSNLLRSNDFYSYFHDGTNKTIQMSYTQVSGQAIDLDLYLYRASYVYQEDEIEAAGQANGTVVLKSDRLYPSIENGLESLTLSGVPAGYYLLNVKANTYNKSPAQVNGTAAYTLSIGGVALCPEN